jgi:hypothetical protein
VARHEIITKAAKLTTISKALHNECSFAVIAVFVPIAKGCRDGHVGTSQTLLV